MSRRQNVWVLCCGWLVVSLMSLDGVAQPVVQQNVEYYLIRPENAESIKVELRAKSPIKKDNKVFHGRTTWQVVPMFKWQSFAGKCGIVAINVSLQTEYLMPALDSMFDIEPSVKQVFDVYYAGLLKHEQGHHQLGLAAAIEIERFLKTYRPVESCKVLERDVTLQIQALIHHFQMKNDEYDQQTGYGRSQGAVIQ